MKRVKVGIVGYGFSATTFHVPFLKESMQFEIVKVMSRNKELVQQQLPSIEVVSSIEEIIQDETIELVIITTPSGLHYEMAKQSLLARKHVVIEKPMTVTVAEAEELIDIAKKQSVIVSVYHNRRWDNDYVTIQQLLKEEVLGEVITYEAHFDRFRPVVRERWREVEGPGAGSLYDLGSHVIDQALHLFGLPQFVTADVFAQRENGQVDDYFHLILGYEKRRVILHGGALVRGNGPRFQVHGTKASFVKYGIDGQEDALKRGEKPTGCEWGKDDPRYYGKVIKETEEMVFPTVISSYGTYYEQLAQSIRKGGEVPVSGEDGRKVLMIIEAAKKSSREHRTIFLSSCV